MMLTCKKCGRIWDDAPTLVASGRARCPQCGGSFDVVWDVVRTEEPYIGATYSQLVAKPPAKPAQPPKPTNIQVILDKETKKRISTEKLDIPLGVKVETERSRTFEHTIVLDWHEATDKGISVGFKDVLSGGIRKEIERQLGAALKERETTKVKVTLEGTKNSYYTLTWTDVWREGVVKYQLGGNQPHSLPIRFRERTELDIKRVSETRSRSKK